MATVNILQYGGVTQSIIFTNFLSCIQQLQEFGSIGQSVSQSVSPSVTLFCHNLNLRIDLRIDPANQK